MYCTVNEAFYLRNDKLLSDYLSHADNDPETVKELITGSKNYPKLQDNMKFEVIDMAIADDENDLYWYLIKNELGVFICREDNMDVEFTPEEVLQFNGFKRLIKSGDKTILITADDQKFITTKHESDSDDPEKALMVLLLKHAGYDIDDIYAMCELIRK